MKEQLGALSFTRFNLTERKKPVQQEEKGED
jgi:hypothetical protein